MFEVHGGKHATEPPLGRVPKKMKITAKDFSSCINQPSFAVSKRQVLTNSFIWRSGVWILLSLLNWNNFKSILYLHHTVNHLIIALLSYPIYQSSHQRFWTNFIPMCDHSLSENLPLTLFENTVKKAYLHRHFLPVFSNMWNIPPSTLLWRGYDKK